MGVNELYIGKTVTLEGIGMCLPVVQTIETVHLDYCAAMVRRSFEQVAQDNGLTQDEFPQFGAFLNSLQLLRQQQRGVELLGLYVGGKQIGFITLEELDNHRFQIDHLCVAPEYRGRGYGTKLLRYAMELAKRKAGTSIELVCCPESGGTRSWLEANGFSSPAEGTAPESPVLRLIQQQLSQ